MPCADATLLSFGGTNLYMEQDKDMILLRDHFGDQIEATERSH
jgi:hypothetical protein